MDIDDDEVTALKKEINNMVWLHCDARITLQEAEERATTILSIILNGLPPLKYDNE